MSADKAPAEKLSLAVRKNVRDGWGSKKADLEAQLLTLLGVPWTFDINPLAIFPYAEEGSYGHGSLGDCIYAYCNGFIYSLKYFLESHGDSGKDEINAVCTSHVVTLTVSTKFTYCGSEVQDGKLRLLFHPQHLGTNIDSVGQRLAEALSTAPQPEGAPTLSYAARHSIKTQYDTAIGDLLEKARTILRNPELKFEPGFEELGAMLERGKDVQDDWQTNLGSFAKRHYGAFVDTLGSENFGDDDLLREGLAEGMPKGVVKLRIVEKLANRETGYNEVMLNDGALFIQTTADKWATNIHYATTKLIDIL